VIDTPGHVEFSSEVGAALSVTDNALVVIDCVEGVCLQTQRVFNQLNNFDVQPCVMINKLDRAILELQLDEEGLYRALKRIVDTLSEKLGDSPMQKVVFGSGLHRWGFTLDTWAALYAAKFGVSREKMVEKLWGDNYFNVKTKKWTTSGVDDQGNPLTRAFCQFVLSPFYKIISAIINKDSTVVTKALAALNITLSKEDSELQGKPLLKAMLCTGFPLAAALLEVTVVHLRAPATLKKRLYATPLADSEDDIRIQGIRKCDPQGPLMIYIAKMVRSPTDPSKFYSFGRIYSGTLRAGGESVRVLFREPASGNVIDSIQVISRAHVLIGRYAETVDECPCGNLVALEGIEESLGVPYAWTLTDTTDATPLTMTPPDTFITPHPLLYAAIEVKDPDNLPHLRAAIQRLCKTHPGSVLLCPYEEDGAPVLGVAGETHLEICVKKLRELMVWSESVVEFTVRCLRVTYGETMSAESSTICLAKSANKHNRLYGTGMPMSQDLVSEILAGKISPSISSSQMARYLGRNHGWDLNEAKRIWAFGPHGSFGNCLIENGFGLYGLKEIKDSVCAAFHQLTQEGILCGEPMQGVKFTLVDATLHADAIRRSPTEIVPTAKKLFSASFLAGTPRLLAPVYRVEVLCPADMVEKVLAALSNERRGGLLIQSESRFDGSVRVVSCHLPVSQSFGLAAELRANTGGMALTQCVLSHWEIITGDPLDPSTEAGKICADLRRRKGMQGDIPPFTALVDKL